MEYCYVKNESQYGLLLLQRYLYEHTDDQHPASVADILAFWQEHGIQAGRKSVYSAIEVLQSSGMDIVCVKSTQNRYFVGERLFELPELKLLVDAVESSHFITAKKSERLIEKLGKLTSESHARQLDRHIYMDGTAKPENECIYYSVDEIHNAIQKKRQITFQYYEYTPQKEKILKHNGYRYQFSPYALIWSRDCYYAVGWSEKHGKIAQFRVDRMTAVEPLEHTAVQTPDFDPAEYVRKVFGMYPDNLCNIAYLRKRGIAAQVIRQFMNSGLLYEDAVHHNCVFVGRDESGQAKYAGLRGTYDLDSPGFKGDATGSDKNTGFSLPHDPQSDLVLVFEAPIDLMSYLTLHRDTTNAVALCGLYDGALQTYLQAHPEIRRIALCLDADKPGQKAAQQLQEKYQLQGYAVTVEKPRCGKDWNEYLQKRLCSRERGR